MTFEQASKLIEGKVYKVTDLETNETFKAEFRGYEPVDLYEIPNYLIFWIEGDSRGREFHYKDIKVEDYKNELQ